MQLPDMLTSRNVAGLSILTSDIDLGNFSWISPVYANVTKYGRITNIDIKLQCRAAFDQKANSILMQDDFNVKLKFFDFSLFIIAGLMLSNPVDKIRRRRVFLSGPL